MWKCEEPVQDTFQDPCRKVAQTAGALTYLDSQASFFPLQAALHPAVRLVFLQHQPDHESSLLNVYWRLLLAMRRRSNLESSTRRSELFSPGHVCSVLHPASAIDTGPLSVSLNALLLCASGLYLLCSPSLKTLPIPSLCGCLVTLSLSVNPSLHCPPECSTVAVSWGSRGPHSVSTVPSPVPSRPVGSGGSGQVFALTQPHTAHPSDCDHKVGSGMGMTWGG